jgi:hypothetical protein
MRGGKKFHYRCYQEYCKALDEAKVQRRQQAPTQQAMPSPAPLQPSAPPDAAASASSRLLQLPSHVRDPRACLESHGFAFVPGFGCAFAAEFVQHGITLTSMNSNGKQALTGEGAWQYLMPVGKAKATSPPKRETAAAALAAAAAAAGGPKKKVQWAKDAWLQCGLKNRWHELVTKLARHLGFTEDQIKAYHVQDEKVCGTAAAARRELKLNCHTAGVALLLCAKCNNHTYARLLGSLCTCLCCARL